jgi:hypothetical protein
VARASVRPRGAIDQPGWAFVEEAAHPPIGALARDPEFGSNMSRLAATNQDAVD